MSEVDTSDASGPIAGPVESVPEDAAARLHIWLVSLFPSIFQGWLHQGVVARAVERRILSIDLVDLRPFGVGKHHITDDYPFGGGAGMVMKPEPFFAAVESLNVGNATPIILLSPRGQRFTQRVAEELAGEPQFVLVSGHYEGIDERVCRHLITRELSIGDFILSGGEIASMVVCDAVTRLLPGSIAETSVAEESFAHGLLEYPQYTRPSVFRDWAVPPVLLSGHHAQIEQWRREQAELITAARRPDLLASNASESPVIPTDSSALRDQRAVHSDLREPAE